ncbi:Cytochrome P450 monooygenase 1 [Colletotrichum tropicale]|nr:Cytochrome P450 monooygenase 1 [Colletotrichum tropicale]
MSEPTANAGASGSHGSQRTTAPRPRARSNPAEDSKCLKAFDTEINYALQKDRNDVCAEGTGQWFFHHPVYEVFQRSKEPHLLLVTAEAGGGKSTIMRTLIDTIQATDEPPLVSYFFFKDDDDSLRGYDDAFRTVVYQLLSQDNTLVHHAREPHKEHGDAIKHKTETMWQIVTNIAAEAKRDVYCIFDAVDECSVEGRQRFVIRLKVKEIAMDKQLDENTKALLLERLIRKNVRTRSFLAIRMAFEMLCSDARMNQEATEEVIDEILAGVPQQLGDQFNNMLNHSPDKEHAWRLLCVILVARRTIKIPEFKVIYALTQRSCSNLGVAKSYDELDLTADDEEFKSMVRARCGLFITFGKNSVYLFHQTAREFLMTTEDMAVAPPFDRLAQNPGSLDANEVASWKGCISKENANLVCATVCLDILNMDISRQRILEIFDSLNAGNDMFQDIQDFVSPRPFFMYAAFNWHEHIILSGDSASKTLLDDKYCAILDIGKPEFWAWFLPLNEYINTSTVHPKAVISSVWAPDEKKRRHSVQYGLFLRESCLQNLFPMGCKVHALFKDANPVPKPQTEGPYWEAEGGYELVDAFHMAFGEYEMISANQAVRALEEGDTKRGSMLSAAVPIPTMFWTCITDISSNAFRTTLASMKDLNWLRDVPEHILYRRYRWSGWCSRTGKDLREDRQKSWSKPWPPSTPTIYVAGQNTSPESTDLFSTLADWIESSEKAAVFAQELWEAGGFLVPCLCSRLIHAGADLDCKLWNDSKTALQIAATLWEHDLIQTLLDSGADPAVCSSNGYTALHWLLHPDKAFKQLSEALRENPKRQPRHRKSRISASVKSLARSASIDASAINVLCGNGKTPLMLAVRESPTATRTLLDEGAEPDKRDGNGRTALMHYFLSGFNGRATSTLNYLLQAGSDSLAADSSGRTVLGYWARRVTNKQLSYLYPGTNSYNKAFHALATFGSLSERDIMVRELAKEGMPLVVAARLGNAQLCWALLEGGANPDKHGVPMKSQLRENGGSVSSDLEDLVWNPVLVALWTKAYVTTAILLAYEANVKFQVPTRKRTKWNRWRVKKSGITPLHLVVGGNDRYTWDGDSKLALSSGGQDEGCAFGAATNPDYPVTHRSAMEFLAKHQMDHWARHRARENAEASSDSEYEIKRAPPSNDSKKAEMVPFDTLFGAEFLPKSHHAPNSLLEVIINKNQTADENRGALAEDGFAKVGNTTPFRIIADVGEMVILPPEFADAIRNDTDLDFMTFVNGQFHSEIPGFEVFREGTKTTLVTDVVRVKITQSLGKVTEPLADECDQASRQVFGDSKEWKEFVLRPTLLDLVARISARVFLGEEGCRNPAWLKITKEYTVDAFIAGVELRKYPPGIRHVIHWFLPQCKAIRAHQQTARNIINEVLHARKVEDQQRLAQGLKPKPRNDAVEWFEQMAKGRNYDAATFQIALAIAAVHTTTDLLSQTLYDIMQHPEIVPALREEIATVISQDGWEKTALYKMKLMDSVIKESQRIKPPNVVSMNRVAMKDVKLPDGSIIPAGSKIGVSAHAMWDPSVHFDPGSWDGYRWLKMRQLEGQENLHQLATTTPQHIAFGHGKHSCPGRFFAANEIKIALCFLLMNYDFKLTPGVKPKPVAAGIQLDSDPTAKVQVRCSEPQLDLVSMLKMDS